MVTNEILIEAFVTDDAVGEGVIEREVALGFQGDVGGGGLRGFGGARVDDDDDNVGRIDRLWISTSRAAARSNMIPLVGRVPVSGVVSRSGT